MFCIIVAVLAITKSSIYQLGKNYEESVSSIIGEPYFKINDEYQRNPVLLNCLKTQDFEDCIDTERIAAVFDSLTDFEKHELYLAYDNLIHTDIGVCPKSDNHLEKRVKKEKPQKWTTTQDIAACFGVALSATTLILQIPIASMMGMGVPFTILGAGFVYWMTVEMRNGRNLDALAAAAAEASPDSEEE